MNTMKGISLPNGFVHDMHSLTYNCILIECLNKISFIALFLSSSKYTLIKYFLYFCS